MKAPIRLLVDGGLLFPRMGSRPRSRQHSGRARVHLRPHPLRNRSPHKHLVVLLAPLDDSPTAFQQRRGLVATLVVVEPFSADFSPELHRSYPSLSPSRSLMLAGLVCLSWKLSVIVRRASRSEAPSRDAERCGLTRSGSLHASAFGGATIGRGHVGIRVIGVNLQRGC